MDPPCSVRVPRARTYSRADQLPVTGLSPSPAAHSNAFTLPLADPRSLAATDGVAFAFLSCWYLDVSVPNVRLCTLCIQVQIPFRVGCPIQRSQDHSSVTNSPGLIAGSHVFHRLWTPSHPPSALVGLITPTRRRVLFRQQPVGPTRLSHDVFVRLGYSTSVSSAGSDHPFADRSRHAEA